jgi:cyclohexanone monooxygenase
MDFLVLEKAHDVGGTWRDNTYPGASCDVESHLYSYSHDRNPAWSSTYAGQAEILAYLRGIVFRRGLLPRIRFNTEVTGARWEPDAGEWTVSTSTGSTYVSRFLVLGVGASGVQIAPYLAEHAAELTVFQRTAGWVLPKASGSIIARTRCGRSNPWCFARSKARSTIPPFGTR